MCGRYASSSHPDDLVEEFEVSENLVAQPLEPDWNVAPTKEVYAVLERPARTDSEGVEHPSSRQLRPLTWGLVPSWAKDPSIGSRMINARLETAAEKPAFRKAFRSRRCLLPADGYYEWYVTEARTKAGKPVKQPYFIRPRDHGTLAMAGLFELWRDPTREADDPQRWRWTCTVLTTSATDDLGHIHDRMPMMVAPDRWSAWLDPTLDGVDEVTSLLEPAAPGALEAYPVASLVSNVANNGPELVEPLPLDQVAGAEPDPQMTLIAEEDV